MVRAMTARAPFFALLLAGGLVPFAAPVRAADPPQRVYALVVYGDDPCPAGEGDEIVVCARKPESERYRIPKPLREKPKPTGGPGWAGQVSMMEAAGQAMMPGSCSPNGSYGFSGCVQALLNQWFAEKRLQESKGEP